jgi:hypothetical protein
MCSICGSPQLVRYSLDGNKICERCLFHRPSIYEATCLTCRKKVRASVPGCPCYDDVPSTDEDAEEEEEEDHSCSFLSSVEDSD